jgi:hypothetical protein
MQNRIKRQQGGCMNRVPDFVEVRDDLAELTKLVHSALASGTSIARDFFRRQRASIDPQLAAHLARWGAKEFFIAEDERVEDFESEVLGLCGLSLFHKDYHIKLLRSDNGRAPTPGASVPRQAFYHQQITLLAGEVERNDAAVSRLNLLYLWGTNSDYVPNELRLSCPQAGDTTRESVKEYWNHSVFNPFWLIPNKPTTPTPPKPPDLEFRRLLDSASPKDRGK